jgi:hypothetical protein
VRGQAQFHEAPPCGDFRRRIGNGHGTKHGRS